MIQAKKRHLHIVWVAQIALALVASSCSSIDNKKFSNAYTSAAADPSIDQLCAAASAVAKNAQQKVRSDDKSMATVKNLAEYVSGSCGTPTAVKALEQKQDQYTETWLENIIDGLDTLVAAATEQPTVASLCAQALKTASAAPAGAIASNLKSYVTGGCGSAAAIAALEKNSTSQAWLQGLISDFNALAPGAPPASAKANPPAAADATMTLPICPDEQITFSGATTSSANDNGTTGGGTSPAANKDGSAMPPPTGSPTGLSSTADYGGMPPCAAFVVRSAIDYCNKSVLTQDKWDQLVDLLTSSSTFVAGAASAIAAAAGATPGVTAGVGLGGLILTNGFSVLQKNVPATAPQVTDQNMIAAAIQYLQLSNHLRPKLNPGGTQHYYAGLWNAVGTACPAGMFRAVVDLDKLNQTAQ